MKHNEFTARTELKSLTQSIKCTETERGRLRMLKVCLGDSSMRLGVPFIAPRQLGAVGGNLGRQILPSVGWHTGQSGAPPDIPCSCPVRDLLPFLAHPTVADLRQLAHRTLSGARFPSLNSEADRCRRGSRWRTGHVRCTPDSPVPLADRWLGPRVARGLLGRPLLWRPLAHRTVRCPTGQSGEF